MNRVLAMGVAFGIGLAASASMPAAAQSANWPSRPIEFIVPWGPGGGADQTARMLGKLLEPPLRVSLPVVNIPGAVGVTGLTKLLTSPADGQYLLLLTADTVGLHASARQRWSTDDFVPIAVLTQQRSAFFVREGGPLASWAEIEAAARTREVKVAVVGLDSPEELAVNFFAKRGLRFTPVPFARPGERYAALLGGHADVLFEQAGDIRNFIDGKQIAPVLFFAGARVPEFPAIQTTKDIGIDLVLDQWRAMVVRAGTSPEQIQILSQRVQEAVRTPEYVEYLKQIWADDRSYIGPDRAAAYMRDGLAALQRIAN